ncbi:MAG: GNAT family N-acetyltransferase [Hyphomonadaceae bacterium]
MSIGPAVRRARSEEEPIVAAVLSDAFIDEAGLNYWLRQGARKEAARRRFFKSAVRDVVHPKRALWIAESSGSTLGAAIWLAPGQKAYDFSFTQQIKIMPLLLNVAGLSGGLRGLALGDKLDRMHPHEPHAHLVFLGVAPHAQGRGVGSEILKATLAPLDASKTPALLEATTERNVALYQRHGFEVVDNLNLPDLHVRIMWRAPQR